MTKKVRNSMGVWVTMESKELGREELTDLGTLGWGWCESECEEGLTANVGRNGNVGTEKVGMGAVNFGRVTTGSSLVWRRVFLGLNVSGTLWNGIWTLS